MKPSDRIKELSVVPHTTDTYLLDYATGIMKYLDEEWEKQQKENNNPMTNSNDWKELEVKVKEAIIATYPDDIWLPVPEEKRAKDGVAAQLLRDMAPALASIAINQISQNFIPLSSLKKFIEEVPKYKNGSKAIPKDEVVIPYSALNLLDKFIHE